MPDAHLMELGDSGLKRSWGLVTEEFLPQLQGERANKVYQEMGDNDPTVGATLYALENIVRQVTWTPQGPSAQFVRDCMDGMAHSFEDFVAEAISKLQYGWAYHEIVYKVVGGKTMWAKLPIRSQDSLDRWEFSENGDVLGMHQRTPTFASVFIPRDKALHFRTSARKNNPQGRSILRTAYRPWWFKKRIEEHEAIGVERDLCGVPIITVPPEWLEDATFADQLNAAKDIGQNLRNDEQACVVQPAIFDEHNNQLFKVDLMGPAGRRQFVTGEIIGRLKADITSASLTDVILLGHEKVGSFALSSTKEKLLLVGIQSQVDEIAAELNRHGIPKLLELNGIEPDGTKIVAGELQAENMKDLADIIWKLSMAGMPFFPSDDTEAHIRAALDLPAAEGTESPMQLNKPGQDAAGGNSGDPGPAAQDDE